MEARLDYIDRAKGILIILVVIGHIWQSGYIFDFIYSFHMPAFFVISGMLMRYTRSYEKKYTQFLLGRVYAFGIPFIFFEILGVLTDIIRHGVTLNVKGYIFNTLSLHYNDGNMWFLVDLFLVEAIFVAARKILKVDWSVGALCALLLAVSLVLPNGENEYIKTVISSFRYLFFFAAGFFGKTALEKRKTVIAVVSICIPPLVAGLFGVRGNWCVSVKNLAFMISGIAGAYATLQISKLHFTAILNKVLTTAGSNSIIIFGTHHIIYAAVGVLLGITDYTATPLWAGIIMLLTVAAVEVPTIFIINRWLPFLAGKRYKKQIILSN